MRLPSGGKLGLEPAPILTGVAPARASTSHRSTFGVSIRLAGLKPSPLAPNGAPVWNATKRPSGDAATFVIGCPSSSDRANSLTGDHRASV